MPSMCTGPAVSSRTRLAIRNASTTPWQYPRGVILRTSISSRVYAARLWLGLGGGVVLDSLFGGVARYDQHQVLFTFVDDDMRRARRHKQKVARLDRQHLVETD